MGRLKGKTALITGGTSGIGLAAAKLFLAEGAQLAVTGRDAQRIAETQELLGAEALVIASEAGNLTDIDTLLAQVKNHFGRLDVLFLNAALSSPAPIEQVTELQFDKIIGVNFKGVFFTIQKALPLLSKNSSVIVTTSITNRTGTPNFSVYGASKAALRSLVQSLGLALIGRGIRVNAINPGPVDTGGFNRIQLPDEVLQTVKSDIAGRSPIKRFATSDEVAKVALFLASDDSSYIVGEEIVVDGGISHVCLP
jgi:NAD(P)-dependent dehydrogenase (short-subunit alcohol dehydrogenase family)